MNDRSTIDGVTLCETVPRAEWHGPNDIWQATDASGLMGASVEMPRVNSKRGTWVVSIRANITNGPTVAPPTDFTKTLRRIVDENLDERLRLCEMVLADLGARP